MQQLEKDLIVRKLKEHGCRITRQRMLILDIILEGDFPAARKFITGLWNRTAK